MLKLKTPRQVSLIVNNVARAVRNIEKLNRTGYNYLYLASGFIAHYNLYGFKDYYSRYSLLADITKNRSRNQWKNFHPGDENYEYYTQKADIYNKIFAKLCEVYQS